MSAIYAITTVIVLLTVNHTPYPVLAIFGLRSSLFFDQAAPKPMPGEHGGAKTGESVTRPIWTIKAIDSWNMSDFFLTKPEMVVVVKVSRGSDPRYPQNQDCSRKAL